MIPSTIYLCFLSSEQADIDISTQYWDLDGKGVFRSKMPDLERAFDMKAFQITGAQSRACMAILPALKCLGCGTPCQASNRADLARIRRRADWYCVNCTKRLALERARRCELLVAQQAAAKTARDQKQRELVRRSFPPTAGRTFDIETLSLRNALFLVAALRSFSGETYDALLSPADCSYRLAPHDDYSREVVASLLRHGLICVSPESDIRAFTFQEHRGMVLSDPLLADYNLTVASDSKMRTQFALNLEARLRGNDWPEEWRSHRLTLSREIAVETCVGYLMLHLDKRHLPFVPGPQTRDAIAAMLDTFSLSQCFYIIWHSVVKAADYMVVARVPAKRAANSVVGRMRSRAQKAINNEWPAQHFNKDSRCCDCTLVELLLYELQRDTPDAFTQILK